MQSKHTRRGVQTCEHVPDDTTQAAADRRRLAFVLAGKADRRRRCLTLAASFAEKADRNRAKTGERWSYSWAEAQITEERGSQTCRLRAHKSAFVRSGADGTDVLTARRSRSR